jgi:RNA exonuclease 1
VLARISIVDHDLKLVYDTLVQPAGDVIDYATQWSGMTEARLAGATTTLKDVQRKLIELFDYNTILVGHSLDNDLRVLKVSLFFLRVALQVVSLHDSSPIVRLLHQPRNPLRESQPG